MTELCTLQSRNIDKLHQDTTVNHSIQCEGKCKLQSGGQVHISTTLQNILNIMPFVSSLATQIMRKAARTF